MVSLKLNKNYLKSKLYLVFFWHLFVALMILKSSFILNKALLMVDMTLLKFSMQVMEVN
jgi:hypothetical protein